MNNMHNREAELAALIKKGREAIEACNSDKARMLDNVIEYGAVLLEGAGKFTSSNNFHDWVVKNKLDAPPFAHSTERSNAKKLAEIALGTVPKAAFADCPYTTPSHIMKWGREMGLIPRSKPRRQPPSQVEATAEAIRTTTGQWPTAETLGQEADISTRAARDALRVVKAKDEVRELPSVKFTKADEKHIQAEIKKHQAELDAKFADTVNAKINDLLENTIGPQYRKQLADAEAVIKGRRAIMKRETFKLILACLHPDNSASLERRTEAFRTFADLELVLVAEREMPYEAKVTDVPRSRAEWDARRAEVMAKRKAARA